MRPRQHHYVVGLLVAWATAAAWATDVSFTPGPGLKKNADGTYSRVVDKEYLESVGASDDPSIRDGDATSSSATNLMVTLLLCLSVYVWLNRDAIVAAIQSGQFPGPAATGGTVGRGGAAASTSRATPFRAATTATTKPGRKLTDAEIAEARAARLARFTGEGPKRAEAAFQEALQRDDAQAPPASRPRPTAPQARPAHPTARARVATLGSLASDDAQRRDDQPDEFFGGDSTNTQY